MWACRVMLVVVLRSVWPIHRKRLCRMSCSTDNCFVRCQRSLLLMMSGQRIRRILLRQVLMKMHVVTFNLKYDNITNALNYADGLAVLGVFFKVGNSWNSNFDTITNALPSIMTPGSSIQLDPIPLDQLLPSNTKHYYRYQGSLTTPPCSEAVIWTVFRDPVTISYDQMEAFRALQSSERDEKSNGPLPLVDNYRPPEPLNGRKIKISFKGRQ